MGLRVPNSLLKQGIKLREACRYTGDVICKIETDMPKLLGQIVRGFECSSRLSYRQSQRLQRLLCESAANNKGLF